MTFKQSFLPYVAALCAVAALLGCKDEAAISALQELTGTLSTTVEQQNKELAALTAQIETCKADVAKVKGQPAVITSKDASVEVPKLVGEASVESLNSLKQSLNDAIDKQAAELAQLKSAAAACAQNLAAETKAAEEALAAAEAAEADAAATAELEAKALADEEARKKEEAAKKKAAAKRAEEAAKPAIVKKKEAAGEATTGVRSRYQTKE